MIKSLTTMEKANVSRRCLFRPYRKGMGPTFSLTIWDAGSGSDGRWKVGYRLNMTDVDGKSTTIFKREDFYPGRGQCTDSDDAVEGLMGFLTLRPGDTDREYFADYTPAQLEFAQNHAEALACVVADRFCDENGNVKNRR